MFPRHCLTTIHHQLLTHVQRNRLKSLSIIQEARRILLYLGFYCLSDPLGIEYQDREPDTLVSSGNSSEIVKYSDFYTVFLEDFWEILDEQRVVLRDLKFTTDCPDSELLEIGVPNIRAKNVTLEVADMTQVMEILMILDPGPLQNIDLKLKRDNRISGIKEILKMKNWRQKEGLEMEIALGNMTEQNLECLKEILTRTRIFRKIDVYYETIDMENINFLFGLPLQNPENPEIAKWEFRISRAEILKVLQDPTTNKISFSRERSPRLQYSPASEALKNLRILVILLRHVDGVDIEHLRRVCKPLRNGINFLRPDPGFQKIFIKIKEFGRILLAYNDQKSIQYQKYGTDSLVGNQWISQDYRLIFLKDFESMMRNQRVPLEIFSLNMFRDPELLETFRSFLEKRIEILKVKSLELEVFGQYEISSILPYLDSFLLKKLEIKCGFLGCFQRLLAVDEISKLGQWKGLEELVANTLVIMTPIREFWNFENLKKADILVNEISIEDLVWLKENLRHTPHLIKVKISFKSFFSSNASLYSNPSWPEFDHLQTSTWYYSIPNSEDVLFILNDSLKSVTFSRVEKFLVPENAWID